MAWGEKKSGPWFLSLVTSTSKLALDRLSRVKGLGLGGVGNWIGKQEYPDELSKLHRRGSIMWGWRVLFLGHWAGGDILLLSDKS